MNREDIIRLALEAGFELHDGAFEVALWIGTENDLEHFAALVAAAEREACAKVCEELNAWNEDDPGSSAAAAIRARGQE
jgi:hypothetical protein